MEMDWYDRAEQELYDAYDRGEISDDTLRTELRELLREYQEIAREAAERAYADEMGRW